MKNKTLRISSLILSLILSASLVACGASTDPASTADSHTPTASAADSAAASTESTAPAGEGKTLEFLIDKDSPMGGFEASAKYIEEKTGYKLNIEIRPGGAEGENILKTRLATDDMPDFFCFNAGSLLPALNPEANLLDMKDQPFMANLQDSYKSTVAVGSGVFGVPMLASSVGAILYNVKVYDELGLQVPKTWDEFIANCEKVKASGKTPVIATFKDDWTSQLLLLGDYYNVHAKNPNFATDFTNNKAKYATDPYAIKGFERMADVYNKGLVNADFQAATYDDGLRMLANGEGAHYPMLTFALTAIQASYPDKMDDISVMPQPSDDASINGLTVWMPTSLYVYKRSENVEDVLKWIEMYISPECINEYINAVGLDGPPVVNGVAIPDNASRALKDMMQYFDKGATAPALEFLTPVKAPNSPQICVEVGSGMKDPKTAAADYDRDTEKQAQQLGLAGW